MANQIKLYPHQQEDADTIMSKFDANPQLRLMYQLPTGGGKSETALYLIREFLRRCMPTIWVTHRRELVSMIMNRAMKYDIICTNAYEHGAYGPYMSVNSILKAWRLEEPEGSLLVLDEGHHATANTWIRLIERHDGPVLALSATPWRLTRKEGFDHIFDELYCGKQALWLVENGYLPRIVVWQSPTSRRGGEKGRRTNIRESLSLYPTGDFNLSERGTQKIHQAMVEQPIRDWQANGGMDFNRSIFYAANVGVAIDQALMLKSMGVGVGLLVADKKQMARAAKSGILADRDKVIRGLETGQTQVCINVMIVTEGVDIPTVDCVVMGRASMSKALVFQMIGRGMRLAPGKDYLLVIDSVENCTDPEIGLPTNIQEWSLEPRGDKDKKGDAPAKQCLPKDKKGCGIVMPTGSHHCPECGKPQGSVCPRCHAFRFQWFASRRRRQCTFCDAEDDQRREEATQTGIKTGQHGIWYNAKVFWYDADRKFGHGERDLDRMKWARNTDLWLIWAKGRQESVGDSMYITVVRKATKRRKSSITTEHARAIYRGPMGTAFMTRDDAKAYDAYFAAQQRNSPNAPGSSGFARKPQDSSRDVPGFVWPPKPGAQSVAAKPRRKPKPRKADPAQGMFEALAETPRVSASIDGVEVDIGNVSLEEIDEAIARNAKRRSKGGKK